MDAIIIMKLIVFLRLLLHFFFVKYKIANLIEFLLTTTNVSFRYYIGIWLYDEFRTKFDLFLLCTFFFFSLLFLLILNFSKPFKTASNMTILQNSCYEINLTVITFYFYVNTYLICRILWKKRILSASRDNFERSSAKTIKNHA